jgi:L-lactate dehydrogenase (cytochrome)
MGSELMNRLPSVQDLHRRTRRRIPHFSWEFLDSGTGADACVRRNREALEAITLVPQFMKGAFEPDLRTNLFGVDYSAPFGVAPVGMSGLVWPKTEEVLGRTAARRRIPYTLSTFSNQVPEVIGGLVDGMGWFQLYPPRSANVRGDMLARARDAGFTALLVTIDVPVASRRERQVRSGISAPPRITPALLLQCALRPRWTLATLCAGMPHFPGLEKYAAPEDLRNFLQFLGREFGGTLDWEYLKAVRDEWDGPLVVKGVLDVGEAREAADIGVDGVMVSNHGGRQFDGAPASVSRLPAISEAVGDRVKVLFDGGVSSGLDIARAIALGADFVLLGRAFMSGVAALGEAGGEHVVEILTADLKNNMTQLGCSTLAELSDRLDD